MIDWKITKSQKCDGNVERILFGYASHNERHYQFISRYCECGTVSCFKPTFNYFLWDQIQTIIQYLESSLVTIRLDHRVLVV